MAALAAIPSQSFLAAFLPVVRSTLLSQTSPRTVSRSSVWRRIEASIIPAAFLPLPNLLGEIWDGLLRAVPKKKTSHMKKRHRQMAGKALKDVTSLNKCSACGRLKRAHILCPYCVQSIQRWIGRDWQSDAKTSQKQEDTSMEAVETVERVQKTT